MGIPVTELPVASALDKITGVQTVGGLERTRNISADDFASQLVGSAALSALLQTTTLTKVYLLAHSWGWTDYLPQAIQAAIGNNFHVVNASVGGQTIAQIKDRLISGVLAFHDADIVIVLGQINSVLGDVSAAGIESDLQYIYTNIKTANPATLVVACTDGPFKPYTTDTGANVGVGPDIAAYPGQWTSGRQTVLDAVNYWIMHTATSVDYRVDLNSLLEDPTTPDTMKATWRQDYYHPSYTLGVQMEATAIAACGAFTPVEGGRPVRAAKGVDIDQDVTIDANLRLHSLLLGFEPTQLVGVPNSSQRNFSALSTRNGDGVSEGYNTFHAQYNTAGSGYFELASVGGAWVIGRVASGAVVGTVVFTIGASGPASWAKDSGFRFRGATFDGTSGFADDLLPTASPAGMTQTTYASGGSAFGTKRHNAAVHQFQIAGTTKFTVGVAGQLNAQYMPVYADNTAAAALATGDLYRTSTGQLMIKY